MFILFYSDLCCVKECQNEATYGHAMSVVTRCYLHKQNFMVSPIFDSSFTESNRNATRKLKIVF